jgi:uncharacterized membrane protein YcaP (DUF421 family)
VDIVIRSTVIFVFLWVVTRAMGKRELAELTVFELLLLVTVGDLVQQGATQEDMSLTGAMLAVGTITILVVAVSYVSFKSRRVATVAEGTPVIVIEHGRVLDDNLRIERVTVDELLGSARSQGLATIDDVEWGILEPDGKFSFVQREGRSDQRRAEDSHDRVE